MWRTALSVLPRHYHALLALIALSVAAPAEATTLCGDITTTTTLTVADSPVDVTCNVTVHSGAQLKIDPGVTLRFQSGTALTIGVNESSTDAGSLWAVGTSGSPITFTSASGLSGDWKGIYFADGSDYMGTTSQLSYCVVEKAGQASSF